MAISVPNRGPAAALKNRQARPLNGAEIREAVETGLLVLTDQLLANHGLLSAEISDLTEGLKRIIRDELAKQVRLNQIHITYPKVGWSIKARLEQLPDETHYVNAELELDLERNVRLFIQFGRSGDGIVLGSLEEEKIPDSVPDRMREKSGLPIPAQFLKPDGTTGTVDLRELRRSARSVDVGSGADNREVRQIPAEIEGSITVKDILMAPGGEGQPVVLPSDLPEVTLEDVVAEPPPAPIAPPETPLPPKGVGKYGRPGVKFK